MHSTVFPLQCTQQRHSAIPGFSINSLVTHFFVCVQQKKNNHTGIEQLEVLDSVNFVLRVSQKCFSLHPDIKAALS